MATIGDKIRDCAVELLKGKPDGVRYQQLRSMIHEANHDFKLNTIGGSIWDLETQ
jgi:hypothetical protein